MNARMFKFPIAVAVAVIALTASACSARADDCGRRGGYSYSRSYSYRSGGCYEPAPRYYYYRSYSRGCDPEPCYPRRSFGFSFGYSRGGYGNCDRPRYYRRHCD